MQVTADREQEIVHEKKRFYILYQCESRRMLRVDNKTLKNNEDKN